MSHEFIILAETGESGVYFHKDWLNTDLVTSVDYTEDLQPVVDRFTSLMRALPKMHDPDNCRLDEADLMSLRGIEIGHIFYFGEKYSEPMGATVAGPDGSNFPSIWGPMASVFPRLVGGIIEASH
jgi:prolyl-tRNA synthetase